MSIASLPRELIREIFRHLLPDIGLYEAVLLRLVSKDFDQEIRHALFTTQFFDFHRHQRANNMSLEMMVDLLVTRAYIDSDINPFLSAICELARRSGGYRSEKKQLEYVGALFTAMTMHHGSREMLHRLKRAIPSSFKWGNLDPWAKLALAVTLGNTQYVEDRVMCGTSPNIASDIGSPLAIAVNLGQIDVVRKLLEYNATVNLGVLVFPTGWKPEQCALPASAFAGKGKVVTILLHGRYGFITSRDDDDDELGTEAREEHKGLVDLMMHECKACLGSRFIMSVIEKGQTMADRGGNAIMMRRHGIEINSRDLNGWTALHHSSHAGYWRLTQYLLESGADVDAYCEHQAREVTALLLAVENRHGSVAKLLLKNGATAPYDVWQDYLQQIARKGDIALLRLLCSAYTKHLSVITFAKAERIEDSEWVTLGFELLRTAASMSHFDMVRMLVTKFGINPGGLGKGHVDPTPMGIAMKRQDEKLIALLFELKNQWLWTRPKK